MEIEMTGEQLTALRWSMGKTQHAFWRKLGVSQACGSRYEAGRDMPLPVEILLSVVYAPTPTEAVERLKEIRRG